VAEARCCQLAKKNCSRILPPTSFLQVHVFPNLKDKYVCRLLILLERIKSCVSCMAAPRPGALPGGKEEHLFSAVAKIRRECVLPAAAIYYGKTGVGASPGFGLQLIKEGILLPDVHG
jgi:hypothetical protein